ncbi:MAG TPA: metalloregulator ArsR/SmtB family transcription factor [Candidatus Mailhella merdigallinarum]|uniref:Metalloregulator ArsR/SmtB family transcription factor n=1 Tax=Candidatus Mailhella merdigallinarum TaxID=2838658 RepID=A0A9D2HD53_9BACT|nr:MAG: ArsR family transcriptional regulator [Desulfovibrionaceae bacterium]HJA09037.1 metalloregulator ArsR/SmtB family transcription factor [Candidatus Mailhella merdigallinarum]
MERRKRYIAAQARIFKALGHPSRLLMVDALREGEKCVCELQALVGDDMSTISKHLAVLREAGVVSAEKRGTSIYYRLTLCCLDTFLQCTGELVERRALSQMEMLDQA